MRPPYGKRFARRVMLSLACSNLSYSPVPRGALVPLGIFSSRAPLALPLRLQRLSPIPEKFPETL